MTNAKFAERIAEQSAGEDNLEDSQLVASIFLHFPVQTEI